MIAKEIKKKVEMVGFEDIRAAEEQGTWVFANKKRLQRMSLLAATPGT